MHTIPFNRSIQLLPIQNAYKALAINGTAGRACEAWPFGTSAEGSYQYVMASIHRINAWMAANRTAGRALNIQLLIAPAHLLTMLQKTPNSVNRNAHL